MVMIVRKKVARTDHQLTVGVAPQDSQTAQGTRIVAEARKDAIAGEEEIASQNSGHETRTQALGLNHGDRKEAVLAIRVQYEAGRQERFEHRSWKRVGQNQRLPEERSDRKGVPLQEMQHGSSPAARTSTTPHSNERSRAAQFDSAVAAGSAKLRVTTMAPGAAA